MTECNHIWRVENWIPKGYALCRKCKKIVSIHYLINDFFIREQNYVKSILDEQDLLDLPERFREEVKWQKESKSC